MQDVVEEVAADDALAHQAAEAVGEHREHGVHVALLDQRLESLRVCVQSAAILPYGGQVLHYDISIRQTKHSRVGNVAMQDLTPS